MRAPLTSILEKWIFPIRCPYKARLNHQRLFPIYRPSLVPARSILTGPSTTTSREKFISQVLPLVENWTMTTSVINQLVAFTRHTPAPITIEQFLDHGKVGAIDEKDSYQFLLQEMSTRLAHAVVDLMRFPPEMLETEDCQFIIQHYTHSFSELMHFHDRVPDHQGLKDFGKFLIAFQSRERDTVAKMANACMDVITQRGLGLDDATCHISMSIKYYMDRLYTSMISLQMISSQHLAIYGHRRAVPNQIGIINPQTRLTSVLADCYYEAAFDSEIAYMAAPKLNIKNYNATVPDHDVNEPVSGVHIPTHLYTIFHEVLKNSMRATVEHHWEDKGNLPPITAVICQSNDDFTIKISDQGGGVARHNVEKMFFYLNTTNPKIPAIGKSLGYGLPLARLYARYFHGDLRIASYEGYGTDVYIYIRALASTSVERLPMYDPFTSDEKYGSDMGQDWTSKFGSDILADVKTADFF